MKYVYGTLCVLGILLPYGALLPWLLENDLSIGAFVRDAGATSVGVMAWLDVLVSAAALLFFIFAESRRLRMSAWWAPAVGTCCGHFCSWRIIRTAPFLTASGASP